MKWLWAKRKGWVKRRAMERVLRILKEERTRARARFDEANALPLDHHLSRLTLTHSGEVGGLSFAIGCLGGTLDDSQTQ